MKKKELKDGVYYFVDTDPIQAIDDAVVKKIREMYSEADEYKMLRLGVLDKQNSEFLLYNQWVEECRAWGQAEKAKLKGENNNV